MGSAQQIDFLLYAWLMFVIFIMFFLLLLLLLVSFPASGGWDVEKF